MSQLATRVPLRRNRDFQLLWIGSTLAGLGSMIGNLAMPLLVLHETGSPAAAGLVGSVSALAVLVVSLPAGAVADAVERRRLMICSQLGGVVVAAVLAAAVLTGRAGLPLILVATVAVAVFGSLYHPAAMCLVQTTVATGQLGPAMSRLQARTAALQVAGPLCGGVVFSLSHSLPFTVRAAALIASIACLLAIRARSTPTPTDRHPMSLGHLTAGVRFVWGQRYLRAILLLFGAGVGTAFSAVLLIALTAATDADPSGRSSGAMMALTAVGSLLGSLLAPRLPAFHRPERILPLTCWICAAVVPLLALVAASPLAIGALLGMVLFVAAVGNVAFETEMIRRTPPDLVGRSEAGQVFISTLAAPVGPLGGGLLAERFGSATAFAVVGIMLALLAATLTTALRPTPRPAPPTS